MGLYFLILIFNVKILIFIFPFTVVVQNRRRRARQIGSRAATSTLETNRQHSRSSPYAFRQRQHCVTVALGNAGSDASDRLFCDGR
jgi:hypothetical protein